MKKICLAALLTFVLIFIIPFPVRAGDLHDAVKNGDIVKVRQLIEKGTDVNARNNDKDTSLHLAAQLGYTEIARLLIERGADVNAQGQGKRTPLHDAALIGQAEVAKLLILLLSLC